MILTNNQCMRVERELRWHCQANNSDASACYARFIRHPGVDLVETINSMLAEGDPYLTQIVLEMTIDRLEAKR